MAFKDKVYKAIVELGEEKTIAEISNAIAVKAFFELKDKFQKLEEDIILKQNGKFVQQLGGWEDEIRETIRTLIDEEVAEKLKGK